MTSLKDLIAQRDALEAQIAETQNRERNDAIAKVKALMGEYGLTIADLGRGGKVASAPKTGAKVAAKYKNQSTGETWSGRGLQPKWLKAALDSGAKLEDFAV